MRRDVGGEEWYCVDDKVPFIRAAALGEVLDFSGDESEESSFLAGLMASEANERTDESPGTVFIVEDAVPFEPVITVLYGRGELNIVKDDLGEVGGVMPLSRRGLTPPEEVIGEVLGDNDTNPFVDTESGAFLPGEARGLVMTWTGYWVCWTTVFIGEEMVL